MRGMKPPFSCTKSNQAVSRSVLPTVDGLRLLRNLRLE